MTTHELKTCPDFFCAVLSGEKTFELRYDDRGFRVGDMLILLEWSPAEQGFTGRGIKKRVSYILSSFALHPGWVCMALADAP